MRSILLPNGNLLIPAWATGAGPDEGWAEITPDHPDYWDWLPGTENGQDPRSRGDEGPQDQACCVRRDCEPHRGQLLRLLALFSLALSLATPVLVLYAGSRGLTARAPKVFRRAIWLPACSLAAAEVGNLVLATLVIVAARRDLKKIRAGHMDPEGMRVTVRAEDTAEGGVVLIVVCSIFLLLWVAFG